MKRLTRSYVLPLMAGLVALLSTPMAQADTLTGTGDGWCNNSSSCNNTNTSTLTNTAAGSFSGGLYNDWFAFALPNLGGTITSATLSIWNPSNNYTNNSSAVYDVYGASGISYAGLVTGSVFASDPLTSADTGTSQYINFTLNAAGLALLNADQGTTVIFGGGVSGATTSVEAEIFGYTSNTPATLSLQTGASVPEPGSVVLLFTVVFLFAVTVNRKRRALTH